MRKMQIGTDKSKVSLSSGADMPCTSSVSSPLACHKRTDPGKQLLGQACKTAGSWWGFVWATMLSSYRETLWLNLLEWKSVMFILLNHLLHFISTSESSTDAVYTVFRQRLNSLSIKQPIIFTVAWKRECELCFWNSFPAFQRFAF